MDQIPGCAILQKKISKIRTGNKTICALTKSAIFKKTDPICNIINFLECLRSKQCWHSSLLEEYRSANCWAIREQSPTKLQL